MSSVLTALSNSHRALSVSGPALAGLADAGIGKLVPLKLSGIEGVNRLFEYRLTLQTPDSLSFALDLESNFDFSGWIGKELTCRIELEGAGSFVAGAVGLSGLANLGAGVREISGLVTDARFIGLESRHALYEITLRPWLHLATLTSDCKVFQNLSSIEVVEQVLSEYGYPLDKRLLEDYPKRDYLVQYNESDFEFLTRLLQEWGINYHFEHSGGSHRLILSDHNAAFSENTSSAYHEISYYPPGHKIDSEYLHAFSPNEALTSGRYQSLEYDYTRPRANLAAMEQAPRNTGHAQSEVYRWRGHDAGSDYNQPNAGSTENANQTESQGRHLARLRMQALRQPGQRARGEGHIRGIAAGSTFKLYGHPRHAANIEYIVLTTHFDIENVSEDTARAARGSADFFKVISNALSDAQRQLGRWQVHTAIEVQPSTEAWGAGDNGNEQAELGTYQAEVLEGYTAERYNREVKPAFPIFTGAERWRHISQAGTLAPETIAKLKEGWLPDTRYYKKQRTQYPWRFEMTGNAKMLEAYAATGDQGRHYTHPWEMNLYRQIPQMRGIPESGLFIFNDKAGQRYWMAVSFWTRYRVMGEADLSAVWVAFEKVFPGRTPEDNAYAPSEADMATVELHVSDDLKELNVYLVKGDQRIELPADDIQMFKLAPWANNPGGKTPSPEVIKRQQLGPDAP